MHIATLHIIIYVAIIIILILLVYVLIELIRIIIGVRRMVNRVELLTDIGGWLKLLRKFPGRRKNKKDN